ncbi:MAG: hypothetical protein KF845_09705 [Cyclobacteriaceae bacterium]|nr:hypothetical protein [Cyclobacteriaceae bacterium]
MRVSTTNAKCKSCGQHFETPFLSDFSYGEFVYSNQSGQKYRYLFGLNNKTWDFVQSIVDDNDKLKTKDKGEIIQKVLGHIADNDSKADFYQNKKLICPNCGQDSKIVDRDVVTGSIDIDEMTFDRFEKSTPTEKENEIKLLIK